MSEKKRKIKQKVEKKSLEQTLWAAADKLRYSMDVAEYKYFVLWLIFLKYISDTLDLRHQEFLKEGDELCKDP